MITLSLSVEETNLILNALVARPFLEVKDLIPRIQQTAQAQLLAAQAPAQPTPETVNES